MYDQLAALGGSDIFEGRTPEAVKYGDTTWKADSRSVTVPGVSRISVKTEDDLLDSICTLRGTAGNGENG